MHCLDVVADEDREGWYEHISAMTPIDCAKPHGAEYIGSVQLSGATLPAGNVLEDALLDSCWAAAARFVGLTQDQLSRRDDIAVTWDGMDRQHWQSGDHYQCCFVMVPYKRKVHATLKNLRNAKLPT
jgi:hypothetical protein